MCVCMYMHTRTYVCINIKSMKYSLKTLNFARILNKITCVTTLSSLRNAPKMHRGSAMKIISL